MEATLLRVIVAVGVWWTANTIATIASKSVMKGSDVSTSSNSAWTSAFEDMRWVDLTVLQHLLGSILSVMWMKAVGMSVWPVKTHSYKYFIFIAALGNVIGNLSTNAAYALIKSSTAQVVKACEPLFTFVLTLLLYRNYSALDLSTLLSVIIIVVGAGTFIMEDATYNIWGIVAAMTSNTAFPVRNIFLKNLSTIWDSPLQKFAVMSIYSVIFLLPILLIKLFITQQFLTANLSESLISSVFHSTYNLASITVLESFSPLTHAILNISKRLFVILANIIYFHTPFSLVMLISLIVLLLGCYLYQLKNSSTAKYNLLRSILLSSFITTYLLIQTDVFTSNRMQSVPFRVEQCGKENRISSAWVFDKPIPQSIVKNIETLSRYNPDIPIHVYCGTSQCVQQVSKLKNENIVTEFLVVTDVVKDTPLTSWLARHPFNKVLARKEFEAHLKEVVRLGILWNYGGYYVDPPNIVTKSLSALCKQDNNAFMSKYLNSGVSTFLDISYFPKNHPFIYSLAKLFVHEYPTSVSKNTVFHFNFQELVHNFSKSCPICPDIIEDAILWQMRNKREENHFGTLSYDTRIHNAQVVNLGDEIQGFPGLQYLPFLDKFIERDNLKAFNGTYNTTVFFNAWWGFNGPWPPPDNIHPIMLSMHITSSVQKNWAKNIGYLKTRAPIGCRDESSVDLLKMYGVEAYFSGCITLLINNPNINELRTDNIYLVDVNPKFVKLLPVEIQENATFIEHNMKGEERLYSLSRFTAAYKLMEMYGTAKLVITQRIHAALPCVGMGTPVIFINSPGMPGGGGSSKESSSRTTGLTPLFHTLDLYKMTMNEAKEWIDNFPWHDIPLNPNVGMMMQLRATAWNVIRQNQALYDAAKKFGIIPMSLPPIQPENRRLLFHLIFTTSNKSVVRSFTHKIEQRGHFNWRHMRCVEAIFYHHPTAEVIVHSNTLSQRTFDVLTEVGYSIRVQNYNLTELIIDSPAHDFIEKLEKAKRSTYWYSHDLLRLLILHKWGGIYLDTDMILVRSLRSLKMNAIGFQDSSKRSALCSAFMMFEKGNSFLSSCLKEFSNHYQDTRRAKNVPGLLSKIYYKLYSHSQEVQAFPSHIFYMFHYNDISSHCFNIISGELYRKYVRILNTEAYAVHLNSKITGHIDKPKKGTICSQILKSYCVLCNELH